MKKIIILGDGGHAKSCCDVIELEKKYEIFGVVIDKHKKKKVFNNYPILGTDKDLKNLRNKCAYAFVAIGHIKDNSVRKKLYEQLKKLKFIIPKIISPLSYVSKTSKILNGTIIMHGAIVNAGSCISKNCIINTRSLIEHDCIIEENTHIAPGAVINGHVHVGKNTFIGSNSVIKQEIVIGNNCFVNANYFLKKNLTDNKKKF
ncbi:MAG: acetyltransferase [Pelagibacteraceae bacterium]|jgi:sugar O-acyltransferase (sialic acid O-acetyltransferase NeuD family)|nr:acetyltransferase [Pelagibacteraceae bacterium]